MSERKNIGRRDPNERDTWERPTSSVSENDAYLGHFYADLQDLSEDNDRGPHAFNLLRIALRYKAVIVVCSLVVGLFNFFPQLRQETLYRASARLLFCPPDRAVMSDEEAYMYGWHRLKALNTQQKIITSLTHLERVAEALNGAVSPREIQAGLAVTRGTYDSGREREDLTVSFECENKETAVVVTNAVCEEYVQYRREEDFLGRVRLVNEFEERLGSIKADYDRRVGELNEFKIQHGMHRLSTAADKAVNSMAQAEQALQQTELELISVKERMSILGARIDKQQKVLPSKEIHANAYAARIQEIQVELAELRVRLKPEHHKIQLLERQIHQLQTQAGEASETGPVVMMANREREDNVAELAELEREKRVLESKRMLQKKNLEEAGAELVKLPGIEQDYARLEQNVGSLEQLYAQMQARLAMTRSVWDLHEPDMKIQFLAQRAQKITNGFDVNKVLMGFVVGCALGLGLAFLLDYLDRRVKYPSVLERMMKAPLLAVIPQVPSERVLFRNTDDPNDAMREAFGSLRAHIKGRIGDRSLRNLLVCGAVKGEGKSTVAANLATSFALDGKRVVLVDADLRRSKIHSMLGLPKEPGLADYLQGHCELEAIFRATFNDNLLIIPAGKRPDNPAELLGTVGFERLFFELSGQVDMAIVDSPAILSVGDAAGIAPKFDGCVLVSRMDWTPQRAALEAKARLQRIHTPILGFVVNGASLSRGYYPYYYDYAAYRYSEDGIRMKRLDLREAGLKVEEGLRKMLRRRV